MNGETPPKDSERWTEAELTPPPPFTDEDLSGRHGCPLDLHIDLSDEEGGKE